MGIQFDGINNRVTTGDIVSESGTISGNLGIGGTLTYEDVTNVDSVGVITARGGVHVGPTAGVGATIYADGGARYSGIATASGGLSIDADGAKLTIGAGDDLRLQHSGNVNVIDSPTSRQLQLKGDGIILRSSGNNNYLLGEVDGTKLYHANNQKFETTGSGTITTGIITAAQSADAVTFLKGNSVGIGSTTTAGRNAGVGTAIGEIIYNASDSVMQVWTGTLWETVKFKPPINVSGGTISDSARSGYITHTFTSPGNFVTDGSLESAEIFVIGGGAGGGGRRYGAGGGAGGANYGTGITLTAATHPVSIGSGGNGGAAASSPGGNDGARGSDGGHTDFQSSPSPLYRTGRGGGGGAAYNPPNFNGSPGGCGGGAASQVGASGGGQGQTAYNSGKPTNYGNPGAPYQNPSSGITGGAGWAPSGGGGCGQAGFGPPSPGPHGSNQQLRGGGNGGDGVQLSISGTATYYGGGGAGGSFSYVTAPAPAHLAPDNMKCRGGNGGGGCANSQPNSAPTQSGPGLNPFAAGTGGSSPNQHGLANTGSGGAGMAGAGGYNISPTGTGGNGGSGLVIVAYPTTQPGGEVRF